MDYSVAKVEGGGTEPSKAEDGGSYSAWQGQTVDYAESLDAKTSDRPTFRPKVWSISILCEGPCTHGGLRAFHHKSACIAQLT